MRSLPGLPPDWSRVAAALLVFALLATAGSLAVRASLSTTAGYTVDVGPSVSEVPPDATVVDADDLPADVRDRLMALVEEDRSGVLTDEPPVEAIDEEVYVSYEGSLYALEVSPRRTLTAVGYLALGAVYLLSLAAGVSVPTRTRRHVH